jgi:hypothetical protein
VSPIAPVRTAKVTANLEGGDVRFKKEDRNEKHKEREPSCHAAYVLDVLSTKIKK